MFRVHSVGTFTVLVADPLTYQPLWGVRQCQPDIMEEEGVVISGVREEEQPLLDCILLWALFFVNSTDQRLLGVRHHCGEGGTCQ